MLKNRLFLVISLVIVASMLLAACGTTEVVKTVVVTEEVEVVVTEEVIKEVVITPEPVQRIGAWVDEVVFTSIDQADQAVAQIRSGDIDVYAYSVGDPALFEEVKADPNLTSVTAFGSYTELTFNPGGPVFATTGKLNPFAVAKVREAMNWVIDRDYMVQEIYGGAGTVKYTSLNSAFPDYAKYVDVCRAIEAKYAYNMEKADEVITAEMTTLGAVKGADGKWMFNDEPVTIILIIRTEDERTQIGDYVADQLEALGFTADRQYKTRTEASPIWNRSNPEDGLWHIYTGGWITTAVSRDDGTNFGYFYTNLGSGSPLWQGYKNDPAYYEVSEKLWNNEFTSIAERDELFRSALDLAMEDSNRVWLVDQISFSPFSANVEVSYDLAGGIAGADLWPYTVRVKGQEGGTVKIATPGLLVEPWNGVAGSNWVYDRTPQRATASAGTMNDPYTGLVWPLRIESADIVVKEGLPVGKTLDWISLSFEPEIVVPDDAWADWDAVNQKWITVAEAKQAAAILADLTSQADSLAAGIDVTALVTETVSLTETYTDTLLAAYTEPLTAAAVELGSAYNTATGASLDVAASLTPETVGATILELAVLETPEEKTAGIAAFILGVVSGLEDTGYIFSVGTYDHSIAQSKRTVTYPADMFTTVKWHDGSPLSVGDFVLNMILTFDRGKAKSAIYDEAAVPALDSYLSVFKGIKIVSTDPLVIETYTDGYALDAESMVGAATTWWPQYGFGEQPWQTVALGVLAETAKLATFSTDKAGILAEENPTIEWLSYIAGPSLEILRGELISATAETYIPYAATMGQFVTAEEAALRYKNTETWYKEQGHFWIGTGPFFLNKVFPLELTLTLSRFEDYPDLAERWAGFGAPMVATAELDGPGQVKIGEEAKFDVYVMFGEEDYPADQIASMKYLLFNAKGELVAQGDVAAVDGVYTVVLPADVTAKLEAGSNKLEVAVTSKAVSIPAFAAFEFVTAP